MTKISERVRRLEVGRPTITSAEQERIWRDACAELDAFASAKAAQAKNVIKVGGDRHEHP